MSIVVMRGREQDNRSLSQLVDDTGLDGITMVEVGSYAGESAEIFASTGKVKRIFCIDPWKGGYDEKDVASSSDFTEVEAAFDKVMERHPTVIHKFRGTLQDFALAFPELRPDLIYIDSEHTYEGTRRDISTALKMEPKVMAGHDYTNGWPGVVRAVDETVGRPNRVYADESWIVDMRRKQK